MTGVWLIVLLVGAVSSGVKAAGPVLFGGRNLPPAAQRVVALMAPTLLAALISTQLLSQGHHLTLDTRLVGLGVGITGLLLKFPVLLIVVLAAAATALTRVFV
jgi:branched-subunit amino acid transport protein